jgi:hypothetical protein
MPKMRLHLSNADGLSAECDRALTSFGLTDRQARFLVTVMRHAGVFVGRQYAAFAGVTHGQKVHDFVESPGFSISRRSSKIDRRIGAPRWA